MHHSHLMVSLDLQKRSCSGVWMLSSWHMNPGSYSIHFNGSQGGQQHQEWPFPLCFQVFSTMPLNIYPISNLVLVWNLWGTCVIQGTKFRPQFLVADLESLLLSHKILVSLKSHSGVGQEWRPREVWYQTGPQKGSSQNGRGYSGLRTRTGEGTLPSQHQCPKSI